MASIATFLTMFTVILLPGYVISLINCQDGTYQYTAPGGGGDVCIPCPDGTFMPHYDHKHRECFPCTEPEDSTLETVIIPCNETHDAVIHCIAGYYRKHRCEKCTDCGQLNPPHHELVPCKIHEDSHCCLSENSNVLPNKDGVLVCVDRYWICRRGQFFSTEHSKCVQCPNNTYMPHDYHVTNECIKCQGPSKDYLPRHAVIIQPCNSTHPAQIGCEDGYYINQSKGDQMNGLGCSPCKKCNASDGMYEGKKCEHVCDTVCCRQPNMTVVDTPGGPECRPLFAEDVKVCAEGQYLTVSDDHTNGTCKHCPCGTFMDESNHSETACKICENKMRQTSKHDCSGMDVLGIIIAEIVIGALAIGIIYFLYRRMRGATMGTIGVHHDDRESYPLVSGKDSDRTGRETRHQQADLDPGDRNSFYEEQQICIRKHRSSDFIPLRDFGLQHLPDCWQDDNVLNYIKAMSDVTVRLSKEGSTDQSQRVPEADGQAAFASGIVWRVSRQFSVEDSKTCPCQSCVSAPVTARKQWGQFQIITAKHVFHDDGEPERTKCDLWFDPCESPDKWSALTVVGVRFDSTEQDFCVIHCITHDRQGSDKLEEMVRTWERLRNSLNTNSACESEDVTPTAVIVAHPHGQGKEVSVGELIRREKQFPHKFIYRAATCFGSAGAPVCILGARGQGGTRNTITLHGRSGRDGENQSDGYEVW